MSSRTTSRPTSTTPWGKELAYLVREPLPLTPATGSPRFPSTGIESCAGRPSCWWPSEQLIEHMIGMYGEERAIAMLLADYIAARDDVEDAS